MYDSGTCGANLTWKRDYNGSYSTLTISGTGKMNDYPPREKWLIASIFSNAPWSYGAGLIEKVIIEYGVTSIGKYAFCGCSALTNVTIPDSVTSISVILLSIGAGA